MQRIKDQLQQKLTQQENQNEQYQHFSSKESKLPLEALDKKFTKLITDLQQQHDQNIKKMQSQILQKNQEQAEEINSLQRQIEQMQIAQLTQQQSPQNQGTKQNQEQQELNNSLDKSLLQSSVGLRTRAWEKDIEQRLSQIETQIQEKLEVEDIENLKDIITSNHQKQQSKIQESTQIAYSCEKACNQIRENVDQVIQNFNQRLQEFQNNIISIEASFKNLGKTESTSGKLNLEVNQEMLQEIERKLSQKIALSVEKLGDLMKKQASIQKGLNDKINNIEKDFINKNLYQVNQDQQDLPKISNQKTYQSTQKPNLQRKKQVQKDQVEYKNYSSQKQLTDHQARTPSPSSGQRNKKEQEVKLTQNINKSLHELTTLMPRKTQSQSSSFHSPYCKMKNKSDKDLRTLKQNKKNKCKSRSKTPEIKKALQNTDSSRSLSRTPKKNVQTPSHFQNKLITTHQKNKKQTFEKDRNLAQVTFNLKDKKQQISKEQKKKQVQELQQTKSKDNAESTYDRRQRLEAIYEELSQQK